jgi:hypothetical protein
MSIAFRDDDLAGGGSRSSRSGETGLVAAGEEPAVGWMLAEDGDRGGTANSSSLSLVFKFNSFKFKVKSSPGVRSSVRSLYLLLGAGGLEEGGLGPLELPAVGCGSNARLGCRERVCWVIVDDKASYSIPWFYKQVSARSHQTIFNLTSSMR